MLKRIHVNQHNIRANAKADNQDLPVFTIKTYKSNTLADSVNIHGPSSMIYRANDPLSCGAKVWCETSARVSYIRDGVVGEIE